MENAWKVSNHQIAQKSQFRRFEGISAQTKN